MMLYISMKFYENILNGYQVIERTQITIVESHLENNSKMYRQE